jgi:hypothetical protein
VNSEELEQSLRTEFENYLNGAFAEMREELNQLQQKVATEIEKHKQQLEAVFEDAMNRLPSQRELDAGFKDSVLEHLRLARDEGARITATAIAEAEEMERQNAVPRAGFAELRAAVSEITEKTTQSEILKSLVNHAENFAPRGAFFVVKNEHFIGWRTFGAEKGETEEIVRDVVLPATADSILGEATRSLATVESTAGTFSADKEIFEKLEYGEPEKMYAIPLVVRGRGVAVLYADQGSKGAPLDTDALETLVQVAGLTVELLASAKAAPRRKSSVSAEESQPIQQPSYSPSAAAAPFAPSYQEPSYQEQTAYQQAFEGETAYQPSYQTEPAVQHYESYNSAKEESYFPPPVPSESYADVAEPKAEEESYTVSYDESSWQAPVQESEYAPTYTEEYRSTNDEYVSTNEPTNEYSSEYSTEPVSTADYSTDFSFKPTVDEPTETVSEYRAEYQSESSSAAEFAAPQYEAQTSETYESYTPVEAESFAPAAQEAPAVSYEEKQEVPAVSHETKPEDNFAAPVQTVSEPAQAAPRSRFGDRNVDLPIEVTEDERRLHNDARRFARLLVSEIKLYNEQKVKEGREASDLYERLREAIDRSREMYDKRVQPTVAARFDYFHYELVNSLAEGDVSKLGNSYPGSTL